MTEMECSIAVNRSQTVFLIIKIVFMA